MKWIKPIKRHKMTKVALKKVFRFRVSSTHLDSGWFHEPSRSCERLTLFHIENSIGTRTQSSLNGNNEMTKVVLTKVFRFRVSSTHLDSGWFHGPSRSCERLTLFHIENSIETRTHSSLNGNNEMTKVPPQVFRFRISSAHLDSGWFHEPSRSCEC